ncbi:unnamed protein product [Adineta ricciae]|uniref:protein-tyrosine-phosphatase n=1 Tax=Adineta ricciae TaxID=249248 RepID=A0A815X0N4_ADIRI|nr:unnamed protein product [Adineta ricciae]
MFASILDSIGNNLMRSITSDELARMQEIGAIRNSNDDRAYLTIGGPSIVLDDFLFLGDFEHANNQTLLEELQIKHILNVCDWEITQLDPDNFSVTHIPLSDNSLTNIRQHFDRTNELLHGFCEKKERCLVHCAAGISRSATIVLAYLMKYHHNTLNDAYGFLVEKRPSICPNDGFLLQLIRYEKDLIQTREIQSENAGKSLAKEDNPIETLSEFEHKHVTNE